MKFLNSFFYFSNVKSYKHFCTRLIRLLKLPIILLIFFATSSLFACQLHAPFPTKTLADDLLDAQTIVFARENKNKAFSLAIDEVVKGEVLKDTIDVFLNSNNRRILKHDLEKAVLLIKYPNENKWTSLGLVDKDLKKIIHYILSFSDFWKADKLHNFQRVKFFAKYLGHPNRTIHELAYLEIARAPYNLISKASSLISLDITRKILNDIYYIKWRSLAVVLMGFSKDPSDKQVIIDFFEKKKVYYSSSTFDSWALAYIQIKPKEAIQKIKSEFLANKKLSTEHLRKLLYAFSIHGELNPKLRDEIVKGLIPLLKERQELGIEILDMLTRWERWEFSDDINNLDKEIKESIFLKSKVDLYFKMSKLKKDYDF